MAKGGNMAGIQAQATQQAGSYPALVAKSYWLQAKRLAEAPFLTRISSTRIKNRINVAASYWERGDARDARGKHLKAAKLYATALKFCLSSENEEKLALLAKARNFSIESEQEQKLALLEKQSASLKLAEEAADARMKELRSRGTRFESLFVEIAEQYCEEGERRLDVGNTLFNMGQNEKAKASFEAAISDFDKAGEICEAYPEECRFVAENILEFRKKVDTSLRQLG